MTKFVPEHPGGAKIILQLAGQDATEEYDPIHPPGILEETLAPECKLGTFDASSLPAVEKSPVDENKVDEEAIMPLDHCLNMDDIEAVATKKMSKKAMGILFLRRRRSQVKDVEQYSIQQYPTAPKGIRGYHKMRH